MMIQRGVIKLGVGRTRWGGMHVDFQKITETMRGRLEGRTIDGMSSIRGGSEVEDAETVLDEEEGEDTVEESRMLTAKMVVIRDFLPNGVCRGGM